MEQGSALTRAIAKPRGAGRLLAAMLMVIGVAAATLPTAGAATGRQVDLRVLVVSAGNRSEDVALELMVRTLDKMSVPYDIVDSRRTDLTTAQLYVDANHGRYNGVILTVSDLYQPTGGSGFTAAEWTTLHDYERFFSVRESVVSGFPTWDPSLGLDYGMGGYGIVGTAATTGPVAAQWKAPAGGTDLFEYVNTANPLDITDFAFTGVPRNDPAAPTVTPLLVNPADQNPLISKLTYSDGREVLLSTISNAWYFVHSNVLAYEFVKFATKGLFIGSRQVYLSVHTDDLFIEDELWDPATRAPSTNSYRMTPADVTATVSNTNAVHANHPLAAGFQPIFAFNGYGAGNGTQIVPNESYTPTADTELRRASCFLIFFCSSTVNRNFGAATNATISRVTTDNSRMLVRFDNQLALGDPTITAATLTLTGAAQSGSGTRSAQVCRVTEDWTEGTGTAATNVATDASWSHRTGTTNWTTAGGSYDATNCVAFSLRRSGATAVNITPIFQQWAAGKPDYGVIVIPTSAALVDTSINTRETATGKPTLTLTFPTTTADPLTASVVANKSQFGFINHTYATRQMDRVCPEEPNPQPVLCDVTNYLTARNEISRNRTVWQALGLPDFTAGTDYLLSDSHAGVYDRRSTESDPTDDIPYPQGLNPNFFRAMQDLGVKYVATDSSRPGQNVEAPTPGYSLFTSPRYPTAMWVNSSTPAENTDQYNWIFHDRFVAAGQNPCLDPAAICTTRTWDQILSSEADLTMLHMVSGSMWPHYMHQINLRAYDGTHQLEFDWLNAVMSRYEKNLKLPVLTLKPWEIGQIEQRLAVSRTQNVRGTLDLDSGTVTLVADGAAQPTVTGLAGGTIYGGESQLVTSVSATPTTYAIDPATSV